MTTRGVPKRGAAAQELRRRRHSEVEHDRGDGPDGRHGRHRERLPVRGGRVFDSVAPPTGGGREKLGLGCVRAGKCPSPVTKEMRARVASPRWVEERRHGRGGVGWGVGNRPPPPHRPPELSRKWQRRERPPRRRPPHREERAGAVEGERGEAGYLRRRKAYAQRLTNTATGPPPLGRCEEAGSRQGRRGGTEYSRRGRIDAGGDGGGWGCGRGKVWTARGGVGGLPFLSVLHLWEGGPDFAPPDPCRFARSERGVLQSPGNERVQEHYRERRGVWATFERCSKSDNIHISGRTLR